MSERATILLVGHPPPPGHGPAPPVVVPWSDKPISIAQEIEDAKKELESRGYGGNFEVIRLFPDELSTKLVDKLRSRFWDVLVVGGRYKGTPELVEGLEDMVNITKDTSPRTRVMFLSKGLLSVLETVERFEQLKQRE